MHSDHRKSFACYLLIVLHIFLGIGALFGGMHTDSFSRWFAFADASQIVRAQPV